MEKTKIDKDKKLNAKSSTLDNLETKSSYCRIPMSIFKDDRLTKKDISVLLTICSYLNNKKGKGYNTCYPSRASIAKRSGYNRADEIDDSINNLLEYRNLRHLQSAKQKNSLGIMNRILNLVLDTVD